MQWFLEAFSTFNTMLNEIVWGPPMLCVFLFIGLMYTVRLKFFQVTRFKQWSKVTFGSLFKKESVDGKKSGISSFQAMATALGAAIGTGNIVGVATAITLGGPGAVFWMWIAGFLGMMTNFAENILGVLYRTKNEDGQWVGGPMYYIERGMKKKWLAVMFAAVCAFASLGIGNLAQSNSMAEALSISFNVTPEMSAILISILVGIAVFGGIKRIGQITEFIVPFMAIFYTIGCIVLLILNYKNLPMALSSMMKGAFNFNAAAGGAAGYTFARAVKFGVSRGVFSNEAGIGSSPIVHAATEDYNPMKAGMWGIFQVFVDTTVSCTLTAFCILTADVLSTGKDGLSLSSAAFSTVFKGYGEIFLSISVLLFGFAAIVGWSYYGEKSLEYLSGEKYILYYKAFYVFCTGIGCMMNLKLVWEITDTLNGLMAIPNLIALLFLSKKVVEYTKQRLEVRGDKEEVRDCV